MNVSFREIFESAALKGHSVKYEASPCQRARASSEFQGLLGPFLTLTFKVPVAGGGPFKFLGTMAQLAANGHKFTVTVECDQIVLPIREGEMEVPDAEG